MIRVLLTAETDDNFRADVESLFKPVVREIIRLVADQKRQAEETKHKIDVSNHPHKILAVTKDY